jgi:uncharacterized glyoxalase superfamily protein PhnB
MSNEPVLESVAPILQVADLTRALDFYTKVLGFAIEWTSGEPPAIASVCRDRVEINLALNAAPVPAMIYIQVRGVDDYFARIAAAGATVTVPLADRFYGMRDGRIKDPDGNEINLGESLVRD